jgi:hypothetical protein
MTSDRDRRRYGVIEVRRINADTYHLTINGQMWSEVEWSRSRQAWCVQDAAGHCLIHVDHIVGQDCDPEAAIRLAKRMIVDGRMPSPEQALASLKTGQAKAEPKKATAADMRKLMEAIKLPAKTEMTDRRDEFGTLICPRCNQPATFNHLCKRGRT